MLRLYPRDAQGTQTTPEEEQVHPAAALEEFSNKGPLKLPLLKGTLDRTFSSFHFHVFNVEATFAVLWARAGEVSGHI